MNWDVTDSSASTDFWSPMIVSATSTSAPVVKKAEGSSTPRNHNARAVRFGLLYRALKDVAKLPEDNQFYLDDVVGSRAAGILGMIAANLSIDAPKFYPQDGEAAVFTWEFGPIKRLLTVDSEDLDILDINRSNLMRCGHELPEAENDQIAFVLSELGCGILNSSSTASSDD